MNELELIAKLRDEVPLSTSTDTELAVLEMIRTEVRNAAAGRRTEPAGNSRRASARRSARRAGAWHPRMALAGGLAVAVFAGTAIGIQVSRGGGHPALGSSQEISWSGRAAASWPSTPGYGTARTEAQLIDYVTRVAAAAPGHAPKPHDWVVVKLEQARSSKGGGGFMWGPPDERQTTLHWVRVDGCEATSSVVLPPGLSPATTLTRKLTIEPTMNCGESDLAGWKSYSYQYLNSLPTDPGALESVILANNPPGGYIPTRTDAIFEAIANLLEDGQPIGAVIPPKLSAALYRILQQLPGVHFENDTDLAGRQGFGFYKVTEGYIKEELVIDPATYRYMGYKDVAITNHTDHATDGTWYIKKGQVLGWEALLGSAVVQHPGQLP